MFDLPRNYQEAKAFFEARRFKGRDWRRTKKNATEVRRIGRTVGEPAYAIQLYATDIIIYYPDGRVFLDAYQSNTTNDRRWEAGFPAIRSAKSMGAPKADRIEDQQRWDIRETGRFTYGLPAADILLDPHGRVEELGGVPIDQVTEHVLVPVKIEQKKRRRVVKRVRELLGPQCQMLDAMDAVTREFYFDAEDAEELVTAVDDGGDQSALVAAFMERHTRDPALTTTTGMSCCELEATLNRLLPSNCKDDLDLWLNKTIHPSELPLWL